MILKRILAAVLAATVTITSYGLAEVWAAPGVPSQPSPSKLAIAPLNPNVEPAIGYSSSDGGASGFYADIGWAGVDNPQGITITGKYVNVYLEESAKGYRPQTGPVLKEKDMPAGTSPIRVRNLKSGTVYKANARAYYEYANNNNTIQKSEESAASNTVKFLTDIKLQCITMSTSKIKIIWDDVWNEGKRISYKLYVSENKDFTNTLPIFISEEQIGINGPVILNQADGSLEYEHTVKDPGRVYYVKIVPDISDTEIIRNESSNVVLSSTYILAKSTKMSTTDAGTIWRLDWSPVIAGISSSDIKVQYQIDKYVGNVPIPMLIEDSTTTFITVPEGEQVSYYIIRANVTKGGLPYYPDSVKIVSDKIILKEGEVAASPAMPEIVPEFSDSSGARIIAYSDILNVDQSIAFKGELGTNTATILWRVPKKANGSIDTDVSYDIWLIENPNEIDDPPADKKIVTGFVPADANAVRDVADNNNTIGYKYKLTGLKPNHTYYYKIVAKKIFAEEVDGVIQNVEYRSYPALKVVITLPGGAIDRPILPSNPPLEIRSENNKKLISDNNVVIQLKNRWYEKFDNITGKWSYIKADKESPNDTVSYSAITMPLDNINYRKVAYDKNVTLYVGCEKYYEGIDITKIDSYKLEKVSTVITDANDDPYEDPELNAPDSIDANGTRTYSKHNLIVPVNQLQSNTTYILWVRAVRDLGNGEEPLFSEASNPIIFTTNPTPSQIVEKPVVPAFNYYFVADSYVDLGWNYKDGNTYYIKYGTVDDVTRAAGNVTVTAEQIKQSGVNYVRIPGLKADTLYYFWIQAEAFSEDRTLSEKSEWSDSLPLRTLKDIPPATPRGFGVKNTSDAVTKNSVTFEWIQEPGLEYRLEVSGGVDYKDVKQYNAGGVSEFKVDGLKSNFRYFARLYAYDPVKKLTSIPTQSISVRTLRSSDDYDSDQDIDNVISGEFIEKAPTVVGGVWVVKITGVNADRFVEAVKTDNRLDYTVDVTKPPTTAGSISVYISRKVFDRLEQLKENITIKTSAVDYIFKAGVLSGVTAGGDVQKEQIYLFNITLAPQIPASKNNELILKKPLAQIDVTLNNGVNNIAVAGFAKPLLVNFTYSNRSDYVEGKTFGYIYNAYTSNWEKQTVINSFDSDNNWGAMGIQVQAQGIYAIADRTGGIYDDIYGYEYEASIVNVAFAHELKSVNSRLFRPEDKVTAGEAVKLVFDTIDNYTYDSSYMEVAVKSGLIKSGKPAGNVLTRQEAARMAVVLYEIKAGTKVKGNSSAVSGYSDYGKIDKDILDKVAFAVQNGFVPGMTASRLNPSDSVTRGELLYMIEKALILAGEID